jgi:polyphosphate glucokinase
VDVLAVDVGGSRVKALASNEQERRRFDSGPKLTPQEMVEGVLDVTAGWSWDVVSVGIPTPVRGGMPIAEPVNLGEGWVGFDYEQAFGKPTKLVNDAAMQALGSYQGGRMLFLGLGTGLGSALIVDGVLEPLELGHLPYRKKTFEDYVSARALAKRGKEKWKHAVFDMVDRLSAAMEPDYVVIGGGGADELDELPPKARRGDNSDAFVGGFRLWDPNWIPRTPAGETV